MRFAKESDRVARALIVAEKESAARLGFVEMNDDFAQRFAVRQRHRHPGRQRVLLAAEFYPAVRQFLEVRPLGQLSAPSELGRLGDVDQHRRGWRERRQFGGAHHGDLAEHDVPVKIYLAGRALERHAQHPHVAAGEGQ